MDRTMSAMTALESSVMELRDRGLGMPLIARKLRINEASVNRIVSIYGSDATREYRARQTNQARASLELLRRIEALRGTG